MYDILRTMCLTSTTHTQTPFRLVRYTCIARMRFGNQIMNKYHIIACKLESYMHDVDVRLILIVHFIQNHLIFIRKLIYFKIHGIVLCKA